MSWKAIAVTMLVSFTVSFAVMWRGRTEEPSSVPISRTDIEPQVAPEVSAPGQAAASPVPIATTPPITPKMPPITPKMPPRALSGSDDPSAQANSELPIYVGFRRVAERNNATEGLIVNQSDKALSIAVTVVNFHTKEISHGYLNVDPRGRTTFGVDDGLALHPADEVTLQSPPYPDLVRHVR